MLMLTRLNLSKLCYRLMLLLLLLSEFRESGLFSLSSPPVVAYDLLMDLVLVSCKLATDWRRFLGRVFAALPERSRTISRLFSLILGTKLNLRVF